MCSPPRIRPLGAVRSLWGAASRRAGMTGLAVLVATSLAAPATAFNIHSGHVVVPVVAHLGGHNGTQWRTDLWIQSPGSTKQHVTLSYYPESGGVLSHEFDLDSYRGLYLHDVVLETFGLDNSKGMLLVDCDVSVEVRARVYNTGNAAGEFGQAFPGLPLNRLSRQGYLSGVGTAEGTRLSLGIANPTDETFSVTVIVHDSVTDESLVSRTIDLSPHQLVQLDRLADLWNLPPRSIVHLRVNTHDNSHVFYAYASIVREDTGDATFIFGTAPNAGPQ